MASIEISPSETLHRAILPQYDWYLVDEKDSSKRFTSALFKDSKGLSVDRSFDRGLEETSTFLRSHKPNAVGAAVVTQSDLQEIGAEFRHLPIQGNEFHSTIINPNSPENPELPTGKARKLSKLAKLIGYTDSTKDGFKPDKIIDITLT